MSSPIIKHNLVKLEAGAAPKAPLRERPRARKSARLVEVDGQVRAIEVSCSCGETILVELSIESPAPNPGAKPS